MIYIIKKLIFNKIMKRDNLFLILLKKASFISQVFLN
jgi:hypothetical protein